MTVPSFAAYPERSGETVLDYRASWCNGRVRKTPASYQNFDSWYIVQYIFRCFLIFLSKMPHDTFKQVINTSFEVRTAVNIQNRYNNLFAEPYYMSPMFLLKPRVFAVHIPYFNPKSFIVNGMLNLKSILFVTHSVSQFSAFAVGINFQI